MSDLSIISRFGDIRLVNEPTYSIRSTDNVRAYPKEMVLGEYVTSCLGVLVDGTPRVLVAADGGATGVHANSAIVRDDRLLIASGDRVLCLSLPLTEMRWVTKVDLATCFGVHLSLDGQAIISHGELSISRLTENGDIVWERSGRDIFTGQLEMLPSAVVVRDFNDRPYRFDLATGDEI